MEKNVKTSRIFMGFLVGMLVFNKIVSAYIDPGPGVAVAGSLWSVIVAFSSLVFAFVVKIFWHPLKNGISKLKGKKTIS